MKAGEAVRIMTGAPVPTGADSVQQVELTREVDGSMGCRKLRLSRRWQPGRSIVKRGNEIKVRRNVLHAGEQIGAAMMAVLASVWLRKDKC